MHTRAPRTFLLSCGGTGGHLSPGIALAEGLAARGDRAVLLISHKKVDTRLAGKYPGLRFEPIPGTPFGGHPSVLGRFLVSQTKGFAAGLRLVRSLRPAGIVGFGGFTTASVILAGAMHGVPVALHEANRVPGKAVRHLARLARRVWLPPGVGLPGVDAAKIRAAGLPVRAEITRVPRTDAAVRLGLDPSRKILAVFGGSQGATPLNQWARGAARDLAAIGVQLACVTGLGKGEAEFTQNPGPSGAAVRSAWIPFCDDVAGLLSAADLVVARAGAGSLAEFARIGTPAILVPYPQAADDHQQANAGYFAAQGGGVVLEQDSLAQLTPLAGSLLLDETRLTGFRAALAAVDAAPALDYILDDLDGLVAGRANPMQERAAAA
ncbi:MAG: UDP-N-acetylglucosamine--N-acetylmuramyl-(pentapeptide) pyrophosphoryl-undecaprenol N-acetylglucosamine transferase [Opitutaceae bacterium]|jgi:UDP-N-acetylglucosamine--N-acetylmuramyl-(pentapeptide) pyrophosphoryl-undecaprenol N-acetylglucosamine transferase|nr:UDP-N-acetylglucosamine--N-acetylmuramyl-(pentapeptide) pyrophosphoryl-undecaprenol N-acetylglucosamine transferase [Opitutaceae bacterium]